MVCHDLAPKFFVSQCGNNSKGSRLVFPNFGSPEILRIRKVGRESRLSSQIGLSRNTETIRKGTLLSSVSVKLSVARTFMDTLEEYQNFPPEIFRLTVPKKQVSESRSVSLITENETFFLGG